MRVRATRGMRITNFYGNYFIRGTDLLALPNCTADTSFALDMAYDESMLAAQVTMQYNSSTRRQHTYSPNLLNQHIQSTHSINTMSTHPSNTQNIPIHLHTLSTHPINTPYQHALSAIQFINTSTYTNNSYSLNLPNQHTLSTRPINTPYQPALSTHPINPPYQHTLSTLPSNTPYQHTLSTHPINPP